MNRCGTEKNDEAHEQYRDEGSPSFKKVQSGDEEENSGNYGEQDRTREGMGQLVITRLCVQPDQDQQCSEGHSSNESTQRRQSLGEFAYSRYDESRYSNLYYEKSRRRQLSGPYSFVRRSMASEISFRGSGSRLWIATTTVPSLSTRTAKGMISTP